MPRRRLLRSAASNTAENALGLDPRRNKRNKAARRQQRR